MRTLASVLNAEKTLAVTFLGMLFVDTLGGIAQSRLPSPRRYLATFLLFGLLGATAALSPRAARASAQLGILVFLAALVLGQSGRVAARLIGFFDRTATEGGLQ